MPDTPQPQPHHPSPEPSPSFEALYDELRRIAGAMFAQQRPDHTLQPTALVHEAYLKVSDAMETKGVNDREHALALGAKAMRQLLINHAHAANAQKRGGGWRQLTLSGLADTGVEQEIDAIALEEALAELERLDERQCRIIECRYLGGLTIEETARIIGVSARTVELDAKMARHWLNARLGEPS